MDYSISDIWSVIASFLSNKEYLKLRLLNNFLNNQICENEVFDHRVIKIKDKNNDYIPKLLYIKTIFFDIIVNRLYEFSSNRIVVLTLGYFSYMKDNILSTLTNLKSLDLSWNDINTNDGIKNLTNITTLKLTNNNKISDSGLIKLTNITKLDIVESEHITDNSFKYMINLTKLKINPSYNEYFEEDYWEKFNNLTRLTFTQINYKNNFLNDNTQNITKKLCHITKLKINSSYYITNENIQKLTNITDLSISLNHYINNISIENLTNITKLNITDCSRITVRGIKKLTNITSLNMANSLISINDIKNMTHITCLTIKNQLYITQKNVDYLSHIRCLHISDKQTNLNPLINQMTNITNLDY